MTRRRKTEKVPRAPRAPRAPGDEALLPIAQKALEKVLEVEKSVNLSDSTPPPIDEAASEAASEDYEYLHTAKNRRKKEAAKFKKAEAIRKAAEEKLALENGKLEAEKIIADMAKSGGIPPNAAFEVRLSPGKGKGMFATRKLFKSRELFREAPLFKGGKQWVEREALFSTMSDEKKKKLLSLYGRCICKQIPCKERQLHKVWDTNGLYSPDDLRIRYIYELASRINHSCEANARFYLVNASTVVIILIKDVKANEEITIDYCGSIYGNAPERKEIILEKFKFTCRCSACMSLKVVEESRKPLLTGFEKDDEGQVVFGQFSAEEIAIQAKVEHQYKYFEAELEKYRKLYQGLVADDVRRGIIKDENIASYITAFQMTNKEIFDQCNIFGLDDAVLEEFLAREERAMILVTGVIKRSVEEVKGAVEEMSATLDLSALD